MREMPRGLIGFRVTLERPGDDSGATLLVTLIARRPIAKDVGRSIDSYVDAFIIDKPYWGTQSVTNGKGPESAQSASIWTELQQPIRAATELKPSDYFYIRLALEDNKWR